MGIVLFRFTNDLRIEDQLGLLQASEIGDLLPVFIIDRALGARLSRSPRRAAWFCAALDALDRELAEAGTHLVLRRGTSGILLRNLARAVGARCVAWSAHLDAAGMHADIRLQGELEEAGLRAFVAADASVVAPEELCAREGRGYRSFAAYLGAWRSRPLEPVSGSLRWCVSDLRGEPLPIPSEFGCADEYRPDDPTLASIRAPQERVEAFLATAALRYGTQARTPSVDGTSQFGPLLSFGRIGARAIVRALRTRRDAPLLLSEERQSLDAFERSLALRDFGLQLAWFAPEAQEQGLQEKMRGFVFARSHPQLDAWRAGRTGFALIDAGIRQLHATGWMHPHVRSVAASFLCFDLGVDWRVGRDEWDRYLIEDDPALASAAWQWVAGVGADLAQYPRIYHPEKQRHRYDPTGVYVRRWIGELAGFPAAALGQTSSDQLELELFGQWSYPAPMLDHEAAARAFLVRYRSYLRATRLRVPAETYSSPSK